MRIAQHTTKFKQDFKKIVKQGKDLHKLINIMEQLVNEENIPQVYKDHTLAGKWIGCRELHIEPDWLLIYRVLDNIIRFERTGSHSELFK